MSKLTETEAITMALAIVIEYLRDVREKREEIELVGNAHGLVDVYERCLEAYEEEAQQLLSIYITNVGDTSAQRSAVGRAEEIAQQATAARANLIDRIGSF